MTTEEKSYKVKIPRLNAGNRTFSFTLSLSGLISAVGGGMLALTFFFVLGVLIGRGYRPESDVPQLAVLMPESASQMEEAQTEPPPDEILRSDQLDYPKDLAQTPGLSKGADVKADTPVPAPKPVSKPVEPATPKPAPKPEVRPEPAPTQPVSASGEQMYDYVYQAASFRQEKLAQDLRDKLIQAGLDAMVSSGDAGGSTWYRVMVKHQGTPTSTDSMREALAKFGIAKPLLKKKTLHGGG